MAVHKHRQDGLVATAFQAILNNDIDTLEYIAKREDWDGIAMRNAFTNYPPHSSNNTPTVIMLVSNPQRRCDEMVKHLIEKYDFNFSFNGKLSDHAANAQHYELAAWLQKLEPPSKIFLSA